MKKLIILAFFVALVSGCAHPLNISPDIAAINQGSSVEKFDKNFSYYFSEDLEKEVTTPGGGGDSVRYRPYKELDMGIYKVFSDKFKNVEVLKKPGGNNNSDYLAEVTISTNSSSSSALTWPPTLFGVNITAEFFNLKSGLKEKIYVSGEGRAEFSEFKSNFNLSAKRASEDALKKLTTALSNLKMLANEVVIDSSTKKAPEVSKETRLRDLKRLFDGGLVDINIYNERQKIILQD
ncbi:membrane lipoprotein lipid attachment site-containing protein [Limnohabitans parvus]|uniref:Lipoprotein n=1 Tax=Limnohabitans parvus II-B4 TaxID=1293052 RepID=A0A315E662_9BURK|nr:membrane lipoprotein lipid attachment site-containing protein [Limnohabitans parvus]PUE53406.1 hypothetical protein B9Z37_10115 [Limnohabitans parvus II-B4]